MKTSPIQNGDVPRAIIYVRVSTARQADDGLPIESQIEQCQKKAETIGAHVVHIYRDEGLSACTTKRPAFLEALEYCASRSVDYFVCWSTSRFARNRIDAAVHKHTLEKLGTRLVYASQDFGESDDAWLTEAITEIIDEQYSRTIARDTRRSMAKNAVDGYWNGGTVPYGYKVVPAGKRRKLEPVETEATIVRMMYQWCFEGMGCKEISQRLNNTGLRRRARPWNKNTVANILKNPVMKGCVRWTDKGKEIITPAHTPIVSESEYEEVQKLMQSRAPRQVGGRTRSAAVFTGLLNCGYCGEAMMTESATGRSGTRYHYYNCRSHLKGIGCASRRIGVDLLDRTLINAVCKRIFTPENLRDVVQELREQTNEYVRELQSRIDAVAHELADVERRLRTLYETIEAGGVVNLSDVAPRLKELRARQDALKREGDKLCQVERPEVRVSDEDIHQAAELFSELIRTTEDTKKLHSLMEKTIKKASIKDKEIMLDYWPHLIVPAESGSHCGMGWLPDLGSNQGPTD